MVDKVLALQSHLLVRMCVHMYYRSRWHTSIAYPYTLMHVCPFRLICRHCIHFACTYAHVYLGTQNVHVHICMHIINTYICLSETCMCIQIHGIHVCTCRHVWHFILLQHKAVFECNSSFEWILVDSVHKSWKMAHFVFKCNKEDYLSLTLCSIMLFLESVSLTNAEACYAWLCCCMRCTTEQDDDDHTAAQQHISTHNVTKEVQFSNTFDGSAEIWL